MNQIIKYLPFGNCLQSTGSLASDKLFTGQRRDIATAGSELYYYGARYYDPQIGRFISADPTIPDPNNPQALNRYSYVINNPLKYTDPSGLDYIVQTNTEGYVSELDAELAYLRAHQGSGAGSDEITILLPRQSGTGIDRERNEMMALADTLKLPGLKNIKLTRFSINGISRDEIIPFRFSNGILDNILLLGGSAGSRKGLPNMGIIVQTGQEQNPDFWQLMWEELYHYGDQTQYSHFYPSYIFQWVCLSIRYNEKGERAQFYAHDYNIWEMRAAQHIGLNVYPPPMQGPHLPGEKGGRY